MADIKTVLETLDLKDLEVVQGSPTQAPFKELTETQILEINDKLKRPILHGGHLGIARAYKIPVRQVKAFFDIREDVITTKKSLEPVKDPIIDEPKD